MFKDFYGSVRACAGQKIALDPLELELLVVVSCLRWMLATELQAKREQQVMLILNC